MGFKPRAVIGDKGFDSDEFIAYIEALEAEAVITSKKNRIIQREVDTNLYADRNKIERFFSRIKYYGRIGTRLMPPNNMKAGNFFVVYHED